MLRRRRRLPEQAELFAPPSNHPRWLDLPPRVRSEAIPVLVQLLDSAHRPQVQTGAKEAGDE